MTLNKRGVNCLKDIFENFWRFNETQWRNPEEESSYPRTQYVLKWNTKKQLIVSSIQLVVYTSRIVNNLKTKYKIDQRKRNAHKQFILVHSYNKSYIQFPETTGNSLSNQTRLQTPHTKVVTLNPSRNTLPLTNNTKSIDLEHLKNTQHFLALQKQKYRRLIKGLHLINVQLNRIQLQSYSTLTWKSKAWCESWKLEIKFVKLNFSKLFLTFHKHITNYLYFQILVKYI